MYILKIYRFYRNLHEVTPIYIGTVPLSNYQMPHPSTQKTNYGDGGLVADAQQGLYPPITPTAPEEPPNYNPSSGLYPNLGN